MRVILWCAGPVAACVEPSVFARASGIARPSSAISQHLDRISGSLVLGADIFYVMLRPLVASLRCWSLLEVRTFDPMLGPSSHFEKMIEVERHAGGYGNAGIGGQGTDFVDDYSTKPQPYKLVRSTRLLLL